MKRLQDKVAIITGAGSGIGRETVLLFLEHGANVILGDMNKETLEETFEIIKQKNFEKNACICCVDVSKEKDIESLIDTANNEFGALDILFNNAGIGGKNGNIWELDVEELDRVYRTNFRGVFSFCHEVIPHMIEKDYGRIVNIASIAGKEGNPRMVPYSATKSAVIGLTKSVGKELAGTGVLANCITPAVVQTRILDQFTPDQVKYMVDKIPVGRTGEITEIAALVAWLSSSECSFSTGAVFDISGGRATY